LSFSTEHRLKPRSAAIFSVTVDETTWGGVDDERHAEAAGGPPIRLMGQEVEIELTPVKQR
jgi:hypothetical protein